jgi:formylglycine-generating enzyme required for sulfatase activity
MRSSNPSRPYRGGCWAFIPQYARDVIRGDIDPRDRGTGLGVRLVEEVVGEVVEDAELPPASGSNRVRRGSSWLARPQVARVAARYYGAPGLRGSLLGVRLVEEVDEDVEEDQTPASGSSRVSRGGCWGSGPRVARVAFRSFIAPGNRNILLGVRLVEEVTDV